MMTKDLKDLRHKIESSVELAWSAWRVLLLAQGQTLDEGKRKFERVKFDVQINRNLREYQVLNGVEYINFLVAKALKNRKKCWEIADEIGIKCPDNLYYDGTYYLTLGLPRRLIYKDLWIEDGLTVKEVVNRSEKLEDLSVNALRRIKRARKKIKEMKNE